MIVMNVIGEMTRTKMKAKDVFEKLKTIAQGYSWRLSGSLGRKPNGTPGELLKKLSPEELEELKNLTADDIKDADRSVLNYMLGSYPESTTTIHPISIKDGNKSS